MQITSMLQVKNTLKSILKKYGYARRQERDSTFVHGLLIASLAKAEYLNRRLRIIQVGANNGIVGDPLHDFLRNYGNLVNILFVEPQIQLKEELIKNTNNKANKTFYEFCAISSCSGSIELFSPNQSIYPASTGIASFDKSQVERRLVRFWGCNHKPEEGTDYLKFIVPCLSLAELRKLPSVGTDEPIADVLIVDSEGHDDTVIKSIGDPNRLPAVISFEHKNLTSNAYEELKGWLSNAGFSAYKWSKSDAVAFRIERAVEEDSNNRS